MARQTTRKRPTKKTYSRSRRPLLAYPAAVFLIICAGVFLIGWTLKAWGADIHVTAQIHGPKVTSPAMITTPKNGQHFTTVPVDIIGTCPDNAAYVEIFRNNLMSGSALCDGGIFHLAISLNSGRNDLTAHVFNVTDDEGPVSPIVTVFYDNLALPSPISVTPFVL